MSWSVNYSEEQAQQTEKENTFEALPDGEYEAFITKVDPNAVAKQTGSKGIEFVYTIREDVEQEGQKRKIFDTIWMVKGNGERSGAAARLEVLASKLGIPNGDITPDNVVDLMYGKPVRIELEQDTYNGKTRNRVTFMGFKLAEQGGRWTEPNPIATKQADGDPFASAGGAIDIDEDDMPF